MRYAFKVIDAYCAARLEQQLNDWLDTTFPRPIVLRMSQSFQASEAHTTVVIYYGQRENMEKKP